MFGVWRFLLPLTLKSPQPWSSVRTTSTFGRFCAALALKTNNRRIAARTLTARQWVWLGFFMDIKLVAEGRGFHPKMELKNGRPTVVSFSGSLSASLFFLTKDPLLADAEQRDYYKVDKAWPPGNGRSGSGSVASFGAARLLRKRDRRQLALYPATKALLDSYLKYIPSL